MSILRLMGLLFGVPILLLGACWIAIDAGSLIIFAWHRNPNFHGPMTFPLMTICGLPCLWLGYRLIFTKPIKPVVRFFRKRPESN